MAIESELLKQQQEQFVETYKFQIGNIVYYYTSHMENLIVNKSKYISVPITRSGFKRTIDTLSDQITITLSRNCDIVNKAMTISTANISVEINRYSYSDLVNGILLYNGYLMSIELNGQNVNMYFENILSRLTKKIPTLYVQEGCNNTLFDSVCGLQKSDYTLTADIIEISTDNDGLYPFLIGATYLTLSDNGTDFAFNQKFSDKADSYFSHGQLITQDGIIIGIIYNDQSTMRVYIDNNYGGLSIGQTVTLLPGCTKSGIHCRLKFSKTNIANFVGMPYIPAVNPMKYGIIVNQ